MRAFLAAHWPVAADRVGTALWHRVVQALGWAVTGGGGPWRVATPPGVPVRALADGEAARFQFLHQLADGSAVAPVSQPQRDSQGEQAVHAQRDTAQVARLPGFQDLRDECSGRQGAGNETNRVDERKWHWRSMRPVCSGVHNWLIFNRLQQVRPGSTHRCPSGVASG